MRDDRVQPFVSVIIPVFNDAARLQTCLNALTEQTYPADRFEVIVVDNGSATTVDASTFPSSNMSVLREPRPGANQARATGLESARGSILAFTDADCIPSAQWISEGVACFERSDNCGVVGGHITMFDDGLSPSTVATKLSLSTHLKQERFLRGHWAAFANAFTARSVIDRVGTLDGGFVSSGETEWCARVHRAGFAFVYAPNADVRHPARATTQSLIRRAVRFEFAWHQLRRRANLGRGLRFWVGQHLIWPLRSLVRDVWSDASRSITDKVQMSALVVMLMIIRVGAWALLSAGVRYDVRARWG